MVKLFEGSHSLHYIVILMNFFNIFPLLFQKQEKVYCFRISVSVYSIGNLISVFKFV